MSRSCAACYGVIFSLGARPLPVSRVCCQSLSATGSGSMLSFCDHGLITRAMKFAVMDPANRDGEIVAHSVSKCTRLGKREVMGIRRYAAAHKTRLPQDELSVLLIAQADRFAQSTDLP